MFCLSLVMLFPYLPLFWQESKNDQEDKQLRDASDSYERSSLDRETLQK